MFVRSRVFHVLVGMITLGFAALICGGAANAQADTDDKEVASRSVMLSTKDRGAAEADLILSPTSSGQGNFGWGINICGDINQDGYDDLLIGASLWNENHGRAYLYFGGADMDGIPDLIFAGEAAGDFLGDGGAALGDVNGDGYDDVIIGARGYSKNDGRVYIFLGGVDMDKEVDVILDGEPGKTGYFSCNCLSVGDLDKDGYADVLVGAAGHDKKRGRVYLYYGGDPMDSSVDVIFEGEHADDLFGRNATIGQDIDGDGYRDIIIGARTAPEGTRNGRAYLFYGGDRNHMDAVCDMTFTPPSYRGHEFGSSLDIYDIDSDGHADVVIGARLGQGAVFVYWGDERDKMDAVADVTILGEDGAQSSLGGDKLFCADFNRDGYGDIAVGAYSWLHQNLIGRTYVYYGGTKTSFDTQPDVIFTGETEGSWFGHDIGGGDFNNDGYTDLVAGAWGYNNQEGRAYVFYAPFENKTDITFNWDTTNVSIGKHTLKVEIPPVPGEQNTLQNVEKMKYFTYRHKVSSKTNAGTPEETFKETDRITYISTQYGLRHDVYEDGQLTGILYIPSSGTEITYVMPVTKQYGTGTMSEEYMKQETQVSPSGLIKEFMSHEYENLRTKNIDGVEAEGIEINEPGFYGFTDAAVAQLWIDIQTNLPVQMEIEGVRGPTKTTVITYDYNWDAELDPSIFQVNIPDDYTLVEQ